jgi:hypothetical protein
MTGDTGYEVHSSMGGNFPLYLNNHQPKSRQSKFAQSSGSVLPSIYSSYKGIGPLPTKLFLDTFPPTPKNSANFPLGGNFSPYLTNDWDYSEPISDHNKQNEILGLEVQETLSLSTRTPFRLPLVMQQSGCGDIVGFMVGKKTSTIGEKTKVGLKFRLDCII